MKRALLLTCTWGAMACATAQCGRDHPSGFWHVSEFQSPSGTLLNGLDSAGLYHGPHVYGMVKNPIMDDSSVYLFGEYDHGAPVGAWIDHCDNGSWSRGAFNKGGGESSSDGKGGWIAKPHGLYAKVGVWNYYTRDSALVRTERYDRTAGKRGWTDRTYRVNGQGEFVLIESRKKNARPLRSVHNRQVVRSYSADGRLLRESFESFWKDRVTEYHPNGRLKEKHKCVKILGFKLNKSRTKEYDVRGKRIRTVRGQCWTRTHSHGDGLW